MLRHRPEPSDLTAASIPRMGDVPFLNDLIGTTLQVKPDGTIPEAEARDIEATIHRRTGRDIRVSRTHNVMADHRVLLIDPEQEAADAAAQDAIAKAVEGVLP